MTPEEFEQNARIVSGDPTWTLDNRIEDVTDSPEDWEDFWYNEDRTTTDDNEGRSSGDD